MTISEQVKEMLDSAPSNPDNNWFAKLNHLLAEAKNKPIQVQRPKGMFMTCQEWDYYKNKLGIEWL